MGSWGARYVVDAIERSLLVQVGGRVLDCNEVQVSWRLRAGIGWLVWMQNSEKCYAVSWRARREFGALGLAMAVYMKPPGADRQSLERIA
jgi:hypothetical protein